MALELDVWRDEAVTTMVVDQPDDGDVARALDCLDERTHTELTILGDDGQYLSIGGGNGRYHVYIASDEHDDSIVLQAGGSDVADSPVVLAIGGRTVQLPARSVVGRAEAARAARWFLTNGRPDPGQSWR